MNLNVNLTIISITDDTMWTRIRWGTQDIPVKNSLTTIFESGFSYDNREDFYDAVNISPSQYHSLKGKSFNARVFQKRNNDQWFVDPASLYDANALNKLFPTAPVGLSNPVLSPTTLPKIAAAPVPVKTTVIPVTVAKKVANKSLAAVKGADTKGLIEVRKALVKHLDTDDILGRKTRLSQSDPEIIKAAERLFNLLDSRLFR